MQYGRGKKRNLQELGGNLKDICLLESWKITVIYKYSFGAVSCMHRIWGRLVGNNHMLKGFHGITCEKNKPFHGNDGP